MTTITSALQAVKQRIESAALQAGRVPRTSACSRSAKPFPPTRCGKLSGQGKPPSARVTCRKPWRKSQRLPILPLEWHFIGPLQSNKTRLVAEHFAWVHSVDRAKIADRLSAARPAVTAATASLPGSQCQRRSQQRRRCTARTGSAGSACAHLAAPATARTDGDSRRDGRCRFATTAIPAGARIAGRPEPQEFPARHPVHGHVERSGSGHCRRRDHGQGGVGDIRHPKSPHPVRILT